MINKPPDLRLTRLTWWISQERLAAAAGISQTSFSRIERGIRRATREELVAISRALAELIPEPFSDQPSRPTDAITEAHDPSRFPGLRIRRGFDERTV